MRFWISASVRRGRNISDTSGILKASIGSLHCELHSKFMQVLQAGTHKLILLELEADLVNSVAKQAGFESRVKDSPRSIQLELTAAGRQGPLLRFDAADPADLAW